MQALWQRRDLVRYFVQTDLKVIYSNKMLGFLWTLLDPLMMMVVYVLVVVVIFQRGGPQFPALLFSTLLAWRWFTFAIIGAVKSITGKAKLIQTIYFPRSILPLARTLVGLVNYLISLISLIPILLIFHAKITFNVLWLPLLILIQLSFTLGLAFLVAAAGVYFRDLENILQFGLRMWFYLSPGLYSVEDRISAKWLNIYMLNPFASLFESYKNILVRGMAPDQYLFIAILWALGMLFVGGTFFFLRESQFAKDV